MAFPKQLLSARSGNGRFWGAPCSGFGLDDEVTCGASSLPWAGGCWQWGWLSPAPGVAGEEGPAS